MFQRGEGLAAKSRLSIFRFLFVLQMFFYV